MNSTTTGFLLSYLKYGDNDAVLQCFTEDNGYESFFLKGVYSAKNKKKAYLQPLNKLSFHFSLKSSGSIKNISKIELIENCDTANDMKINTMVFFVADFLNQVLRNESRNITVYSEISELINQLKSGNNQSHLIFLFKILKNQGIHPLNNEHPYLDPESGVFKPQESHHLFDVGISDIWKELSVTENFYAINITAKNRRKFLESLLVYYHFHFTDFRTPQSLEIVQQIFN